MPRLLGLRRSRRDSTLLCGRSTCRGFARRRQCARASCGRWRSSERGAAVASPDLSPRTLSSSPTTAPRRPRNEPCRPRSASRSSWQSATRLAMSGRGRRSFLRLRATASLPSTASISRCSFAAEPSRAGPRRSSSGATPVRSGHGSARSSHALQPDSRKRQSDSDGWFNGRGSGAAAASSRPSRRAPRGALPSYVRLL